MEQPTKFFIFDVLLDSKGKLCNSKQQFKGNQRFDFSHTAEVMVNTFDVKYIFPILYQSDYKIYRVTMRSGEVYYIKTEEELQTALKCIPACY